MRPDFAVAGLVPQPPLQDEIAAGARGCDEDSGFPAAALQVLRRRGMLARPPLRGDEIGDLLALLALVGRGDLSTGRIFEGHVNALLLIRSYGTPAQIRFYEECSKAGDLFGVWNTDAPDDPLRLESGRLAGKKSFATGIDGLSFAIVTVTDATGRRMIVAPVAGLPVDRSWWRPTGMRASGSHIVDFTGLAVDQAWMLGGSDDYIRQPWFSAGAIRFAAVQTGGMHGIFEAAVAHLRSIGRLENPFQAHRVARMAIAVETGYAWLDRAAEAWAAAARGGDHAHDRAMAVANATRAAVEAAALSVLEDAERGVGAAGFIAPHPLEQRMRDLRTYLRQPNPDGALAALAEAVAAGHWSPGTSANASRFSES